MRGDTVTLFHRLGEDAKGRAKWQRTVIRGATVFRKDGIRQNSAQNLQSIDNLIVFLHDGGASADARYMDAAAYQALSAWARGMFYTIAADGSDRIVIGETDTDAPGEPNGGATRRIVTVQYNRSAHIERLNNIRLICE